MNNTIINEELIQGKPLDIERHLQVELANQILSINGNNYENIVTNMKMMADVIEILEEHINEETITLRYNPMGEWYIDGE